MHRQQGLPWGHPCPGTVLCPCHGHSCSCLRLSCPCCSSGWSRVWSPRDAQEGPQQLLSHISIGTKVLSHNLISFSVLRVKGSSQGSGLFLRKLIPIFTLIHCCDLKLLRHRQKKWQSLGAPGIHPTKMKVNPSKWSRVLLVLVAVLLVVLGVPGCGHMSGSRQHHCPTTEAPGPKEDVNGARNRICNANDTICSGFIGN